MAEKLISDIQFYTGTAAERAAMSTTGLSIGSSFEETDTGLIYKWDGSAWFVSGNVGAIPVASDTVLQGNITLDGSAQQLHSDTASKSVTIQSAPGNTGDVYVGKSNVSSSVHMFTLEPGDGVSFNISNLNKLYVRGTSSDEVSYGGEV